LPMAKDEKRNLTPTISRALSDGTLVELLYNAEERTTALAVSRPEGRVSVEPFLDLANDERLVPYSSTNNLITTGCVLLPSAVAAFGGKASLLEDIRAFVHRYVDLSPLFEDIAAHYVLLSWVYDAFNELGYLRFRGDYGTGKTRALLAVGSLCYKPFFASGASTVSPIFHVLDAFAGTLVLDEADLRFSDSTAELSKILNNGTTIGLPVLRTLTNRYRELNPRAFRVFGPKLIAMRESFADRALESRFLTEETGGRALRDDVPIQLPRTLAPEALALRNRLLAWRFAARFQVQSDPSRLIRGIEPRLNQTALALLSLVDDPVVRSQIGDALVGEEARVLQERASSFDATMLVAVREAFDASDNGNAPISAIADAFNRRAAAERGKPATNKWVGTFLRQRLRLATVKSHGVYVLPPAQRAKVNALAVRYGIVDARPAGAGRTSTAPARREAASTDEGLDAKS
jgi:hypothetical protein